MPFGGGCVFCSSSDLSRGGGARLKTKGSLFTQERRTALSAWLCCCWSQQCRCGATSQYSKMPFSVIVKEPVSPGEWPDACVFVLAHEHLHEQPFGAICTVCFGGKSFMMVGEEGQMHSIPLKWNLIKVILVENKQVSRPGHIALLLSFVRFYLYCQTL